MKLIRQILEKMPQGSLKVTIPDIEPIAVVLVGANHPREIIYIG
ncbi:hypothetical protein N752_31085 [Desulforamulus aquiferis]|nr:hypothetical protein N752_31085 [Desulforamulus aquiferis]